LIIKLYIEYKKTTILIINKQFTCSYALLVEDYAKCSKLKVYADEYIIHIKASVFTFTTNVCTYQMSYIY